MLQLCRTGYQLARFLQQCKQFSISYAQRILFLLEQAQLGLECLGDEAIGFKEVSNTIANGTCCPLPSPESRPEASVQQTSVLCSSRYRGLAEAWVTSQEQFRAASVLCRTAHPGSLYGQLSEFTESQIFSTSHLIYELAFLCDGGPPYVRFQLRGST